MKKVSMYLLSTLFLGMMMSCKKDAITVSQSERTPSEHPESSDQLLTKIIRTTYLGSEVTFDEAIKYEYNEARKIITEGKKTYVRDEQQRIVRIFNSNNCDGRPDTKVYYSDVNPNEIVYTFSPLDAIGATDSVVYVHANGRLTKTMSYIHAFATATCPEHTSLERYNTFDYDDEGNLSKVNSYSINSETGNTIHCGQLYFKDYYKTANPLYTSEEIRTGEVGYEGIINSSKNNFYSIDRYTKDYEYRADGRPRTCLVKYNGSLVYKLSFNYE